MILCLCSTPAEAEVFEQLVAGQRHRCSPAVAAFLDQVKVAVFPGQSLPLPVTSMDVEASDVFAAPMTYAQVQAVAHIAPSTISRLVRAGELEKVGRRISVPSLRRYLAGRSSVPAAPADERSPITPSIERTTRDGLE